MKECEHEWGYGGDCEACGVGIVDAYAELEAENSELTTWWKFEEACKNRACSKELDYIERITALESENKALREEALTDAENRRIVGIAADQIREDIRTGKRERMSLLGVQK